MDYIISGLQIGLIYSLLSFGIFVIYRTTRVLNFAHGDIATFGTFVSLSILEKTGNSLISIILGSTCGGVISFFLYRFVIYEGERRGANPLSLTIITIAFAYILQSIEIIIWGTEPKAFPSITQERIFIFSSHFILIFSTSLLILVIMYLITMRTRFGIFIRAISQNREASATLGINIKNVVGTVWFISAFIGGIAGSLIAPLYFVDQFFLFDPFVKSFIGAVIGGLDNPFGVVLGSLIVGITENLFGGYVSIKFKTAFVFVIGLIFLLMRPEGILGRELKERV